MKILIATDSFKGCLTSFEAGMAMAEGIERAHKAICPTTRLDVYIKPMADGGEGTAFALGTDNGAEIIFVPVMNPVGIPINAEFYYVEETGTAYIDVAAASGITLLSPDEIDAKRTSTFGTGQLIDAAILTGASNIVLCLGGSATVDLGVGALQALGVEFYDEEGDLIDDRLTGGDLKRIMSFVIPDGTREWLSHAELWLLSDVETPLIGELGAANIFGPQKGLSSDEIEDFSYQLERVGMMLKQDMEALTWPRTGAAGGIGVGLSILAETGFLPGAQTVIRATDIDKAMEGADLVITGEGRSDSQTLLHKAPFEVMKTAEEKGIPTLLLSGRIANGESGRQMLLDAGFYEAVCINGNIDETPLKPENSDSAEFENPLDPEVAKRRLAAAAERAVGEFLKDFLREKSK